MYSIYDQLCLNNYQKDPPFSIKGATQIRAYVGLPHLHNEEQKKSLKLREMQAAKKYT